MLGKNLKKFTNSLLIISAQTEPERSVFEFGLIDNKNSNNFRLVSSQLNRLYGLSQELLLKMFTKLELVSGQLGVSSVMTISRA